MVLPLIAAGIGAAGNIIGGILGSSAQKKADRMNFEIAKANLIMEQKARAEALAEAHRQEAEQKLGTTDAWGNKYHFVEGQGWVVDLSPKSREMQDLYHGEEIQQMAQDLPAKRAQMFNNLARQGREENAASGLLQAFLRNYREDPSAIIARRNLMSEQGLNESTDSVIQAAMQNAVRTGSSNAGTILAAINKQRGGDLRKAFMENQEGASQDAESRYFTEQGNLANMYNTMATRASGMPNVDYNPRNLEGQENEILGNMRGGTQTANTNLLNVLGSSPGKLDYTAQPNYGIANTVAQAGSTIAAGINQYDASRNSNDFSYNSSPYGNYAYTNYYPPAPVVSGNSSMYNQGIGPWGRSL